MPQRRKERGTMLYTAWEGAAVPYDAAGTRFYAIETLANATDRLVRESDRFIAPSIQSVLGPAPLTSLAFALLREEEHRLVFRLRAANSKRKRGVFAYVAAKNHLECSVLLRAEFGHLSELHRRAPAWVVEPYRSGTVFLPDRHGRKTHGREVSAYVARWLGGYQGLGIHKNGQFLLEAKRPHTLTKHETEAVKQLIIRVLAGTYDPGEHRAVSLRDMRPGDFMIKETARGEFVLKLVSCRQMRRRVSPEKLVHQILTTRWSSPHAPLALAPYAPEDLWNALIQTVGQETARQWVARYVDAVAAGAFPSGDEAYVEALKRLVLK